MAKINLCMEEKNWKLLACVINLLIREKKLYFIYLFLFQKCKKNVLQSFKILRLLPKVLCNDMIFLKISKQFSLNNVTRRALDKCIYLDHSSVTPLLQFVQRVYENKQNRNLFSQQIDNCKRSAVSIATKTATKMLVNEARQILSRVGSLTARHQVSG